MVNSYCGHTYICTHLKQNIIKIQSCAYSLRSLRAAVNQPPSSFLVVIQHFLIAVGFWSILINCVGGASARADGSNLKIFLCQSFGSRKHQKLQTHVKGIQLIYLKTHVLTHLVLRNPVLTHVLHLQWIKADWSVKLSLWWLISCFMLEWRTRTTF